MKYQPRELSRFSVSGKTFFFNQAKARTGSPYLVINALAGNRPMEKLVLFPPHFVEFYKNIQSAALQVAGLSLSGGPIKRPELDYKCRKCGAMYGAFRVGYEDNDTEKWFIYCDECKERHHG